MKVALFSSGSGSRGGGEIYLRLLAEGLAQAGHDIATVLPDAARMDELAGQIAPFANIRRIPYVATYERRLRNLSAASDDAQIRQLTAFMKSLDSDVLHLNQQVAEDGLDLVRAARRSGLPWISTIHITRPARELGTRMATLRDWATARVLDRPSSRYVAVSRDSARRLSARLRNRSVEIDTVYCGVPAAGPEEYGAARHWARSDWKVGAGELVIGSVGRIEPQKDPLNWHERVGAACAEWDQAAKLIWIGDGSLRAELEAKAARAPSWPPLVVDGWRPDASTRLAGLDLLVLMSRFEGLPLVILEAMHAGVPVVAANVDGVSEAVEHGRTGLLCSTPEEWGDAVRRLAGGAELRAAMGKAAREAAQARFSLSAMAANTARVYSAVRQGASG